MSRSNTSKNASGCSTPQEKFVEDEKEVRIYLSFVNLDVVRIIWLSVNCLQPNNLFQLNSNQLRLLVPGKISNSKYNKSIEDN